MKKLCAFCLLLFISLCVIKIEKTLVYSEANRYYYTSCVEHLFTHCLIAYPNLAFDKNNSMRKHYATDCITAKEFLMILEQLYEKDYILVSINDCFSINPAGIAEKRKVKVPIGKKPLILSFDDVNYDQKKLGLGMVDKIILDKNGNLASQTKIGNKLEIRYDNEFIPILERFIEKNPDFSLNGARGTINLTGYDGILGYRTSNKNTVNREEEIQAATEVVKKLKANGWNFACHSYGHYHMKKISLEKFKIEIELWNKEITPIIGKTNIYVYPYGEWEIFENGNFSKKHQILIDNGFKLFCGVGMKTYYSYLPNKNNLKVLFMDRKCIDGRTLKLNRTELHPFFNPIQILDDKRKILDYTTS